MEKRLQSRSSPFNQELEERLRGCSFPFASQGCFPCRGSKASPQSTPRFWGLSPTSPIAAALKRQRRVWMGDAALQPPPPPTFICQLYAGVWKHFLLWISRSKQTERNIGNGRLSELPNRTGLCRVLEHPKRWPHNCNGSKAGTEPQRWGRGCSSTQLLAWEESSQDWPQRTRHRD